MFDLAQNEQRSDDEISFYMLYIIFEPKINETASNLIIVIQTLFKRNSAILYDYLEFQLCLHAHEQEITVGPSQIFAALVKFCIISS